ncbi:MAG: phage holin family protein [Lachnospiraceae bacterium]|nr:phage holin family protein [Lachnospiraceae bacterium]
MFITAAGGIGGALSYLLGGFDTALQTLLIFMAADYLTGIVVAGVFHKSGKTASGCLESRAGFKGICRKGLMLLVVMVAVRLDMLMGTAFLRDAAMVAFICNEALSIIENGGLMGIPIPEKITDAIEILGKKGDGDE